jgi:hypothetical protein
MSLPLELEPQLLVIALFSRHYEALEWGRHRLEEGYSSVILASEIYPFDFTAYYEKVMGPNLLKQLLVFANLMHADQLATIKRRTILLEQELAASGLFPESRPLNLDPGFLGLRKLVLATTKDQIHRVYLRDGIFAEVTLIFHEGAFRPLPWTYADYQQPSVIEFLHQARKYFLERRRERP